MERIVLDTNVWISGFLVPEGKPAKILVATIKGEFHGIISDYILREIEQTLSRPRIFRKYLISREEIVAFIITLQRRLEIVEPAEIDVEIRDRDDIPILGTAIAGRATHLITGDNDLLCDENLKNWMRRQGVEIVSPADFNL